MSSTKELIIDLVKDLPEDKINSVIDFIKFIKSMEVTNGSIKRNN